jgi:hypothetical protein
VHADGPARRPRSGASARLLAAVRERCTLEDATVSIRATRELWGLGSSLVLVAPDGSRHRVLDLRADGPVGERKSVATIASVRGLASEGIWELAAPRAWDTLVLERLDLSLACAGDATRRSSRGSSR